MPPLTHQTRLQEEEVRVMQQVLSLCQCIDGDYALLESGVPRLTAAGKRLPTSHQAFILQHGTVGTLWLCAPPSWLRSLCPCTSLHPAARAPGLRRSDRRQTKRTTTPDLDLDQSYRLGTRCRRLTQLLGDPTLLPTGAAGAVHQALAAAVMTDERRELLRTLAMLQALVLRPVAAGGAADYLTTERLAVFLADVRRRLAVLVELARACHGKQVRAACDSFHRTFTTVAA